MSDPEKVLIKNFKKFINICPNVPERLAKICPSSYKHQQLKFRKRKYNALNNRQIISVYDKYANCKYFLTKHAKEIDYFIDETVYEIWMIECERIGLGEIQSPILYKIM